jgi:hypothetical protein
LAGDYNYKLSNNDIALMLLDKPSAKPILRLANGEARQKPTAAILSLLLKPSVRYPSSISTTTSQAEASLLCPSSM